MPKPFGCPCQKFLPRFEESGISAMVSHPFSSIFYDAGNAFVHTSNRREKDPEIRNVRRIAEWRVEISVSGQMMKILDRNDRIILGGDDRDRQGAEKRGHLRSGYNG